MTDTLQTAELRSKVRRILVKLCPALNINQDYEPTPLEKNAIARVNQVVDGRTNEILALIRKEAYRLSSEAIGEDEPDTTKDAYSTSALVKDGRNSLRAEQRQRLSDLTNNQKEEV